MGWIYKRGGRYWIKYYKNGKPIREATHSKKEADAKQLLKKREGEIAQGKIPGFYFDRVTFDELADEFLTDYRINKRKSIDTAKRKVYQLKKTFGGNKVTDITSQRIKEYITDRLDEGMANATVNRDLSALKRILNLGAEQTPPKVDRVPSITMLQESDAREGFFEHGEFIALRKALPDYLYGFVTFAYKTGCRFTEISKLTWDKVDLDLGIVRLEPRTTKTKKARNLSLDGELKNIFSDLDARRKKAGGLIQYVFPNKSGKDRITNIVRDWKKACIEAGLCRLEQKGEKTVMVNTHIFHDFRRTAIRNMIRAGVPERIAMRISGHKTRSVFDRYNIVSDEDLKDAANKQEAYLEAMGTVLGTDDE